MNLFKKIKEMFPEAPEPPRPAWVKVYAVYDITADGYTTNATECEIISVHDTEAEARAKRNRLNSRGDRRYAYNWTEFWTCCNSVRCYCDTEVQSEKKDDGQCEYCGRCPCTCGARRKRDESAWD